MAAHPAALSTNSTALAKDVDNLVDRPLPLGVQAPYDPLWSCALVWGRGAIVIIHIHIPAQARRDAIA